MDFEAYLIDKHKENKTMQKQHQEGLKFTPEEMNAIYNYIYNGGKLSQDLILALGRDAIL